MKPQTLLNCMAFRGIRYITSLPPPTLFEAIFILLFRGIAGGFLLYYLASWLQPAIQWHMVTSSIWFYIAMFIIGMAWVHVFVWTAIIAIPLSTFGFLKPITDFLWSSIVFVAIAVAFVIYSFAGIASNRS